MGIPCRRFPDAKSDKDIDGSFWTAGAGAFLWLPRSGKKAILLVLPNGIAHLPVMHYEECAINNESYLPPSGFWRWDGEYDKPSLSPSIQHTAGEAGVWHGFLVSGELLTT